jgi:hypothetical protein
MAEAEPAADPPADYRDRFEALTGQSLRECPHCHTGIMVVVDCIARPPLCSVAQSLPASSGYIMTQDRRSNRTKPNYQPGRVGGACAARIINRPRTGPDVQILDIMTAEGVAAEVRAFHPTPLSRARSPAIPRLLIGKRPAGIQCP